MGGVLVNEEGLLPLLGHNIGVKQLSQDGEGDLLRHRQGLLHRFRLRAGFTDSGTRLWSRRRLLAESIPGLWNHDRLCQRGPLHGASGVLSPLWARLFPICQRRSHLPVGFSGHGAKGLLPGRRVGRRRGNLRRLPAQVQLGPVLRFVQGRQNAVMDAVKGLPCPRETSPLFWPDAHSSTV